MRPTDKCPVSVVIPTRDRGAVIQACIGSLLGCSPPPGEIIVVDQNAAQDTAGAVAPFGGSVRYIHCPSIGVSAARNTGIRNARFDLVALTDDDCIVAPDWPGQIMEHFRDNPGVGLLYGNVQAGEHDPAQGFITAYDIPRSYIATGFLDKPKVEGISANMALRRSACESLGGFDEMLGVGAPLRSAGETDYTFRALQARIAVMESPKVRVVHNGFRNSTDGDALVRRYLFGIGAMLAKHVRCRPVAGLYLLFRLAARWMFGRPVVNLGLPLRRALRLRAFVEGFKAGFIAPVDRRACRFLPSQPARPRV